MIKYVKILQKKFEVYQIYRLEMNKQKLQRGRVKVLQVVAARKEQKLLEKKQFL